MTADEKRRRFFERVTGEKIESVVSKRFVVDEGDDDEAVTVFVIRAKGGNVGLLVQPDGWATKDSHQVFAHVIGDVIDQTLAMDKRPSLPAEMLDVAGRVFGIMVAQGALKRGVDGWFMAPWVPGVAA